MTHPDTKTPETTAAFDPTKPQTEESDDAAFVELRAAAQKALNYITNTEGELGITLDSGNALREVLARRATTKSETDRAALVNFSADERIHFWCIADALYFSSPCMCCHSESALKDWRAKHDRTEAPDGRWGSLGLAKLRERYAELDYNYLKALADGVELKIALQECYDTMHECTAVLSATDCKTVAVVMSNARAALARTSAALIAKEAKP